MAYNGSGTYNLPSGQPVVTGTTISSTTHNTLASDLANALSTAICKDGQTTITQNIPFNSKRITGLGAGTAVGDAAQVSQIQNSAFTYLTSVTGTDTIAGTATPTPSAYAAGQWFVWIPAGTNTGATTLNVSSLGAKAVQLAGSALVGGEIVSGLATCAVYDGTQFQLMGIVGSTIATLLSGVALDLNGGVLSGHAGSIVTLSSNTNLANAAHRGSDLVITGNNTLTIQPNATEAYDTGFQCVVIATHASGATVTADTGVSLNGTATGSASISQYQGFSLLRTGSDAWLMPNASVS